MYLIQNNTCQLYGLQKLHKIQLEVKLILVSFAFKQPQSRDDIVKLSNGNIAN